MTRSYVPPSCSQHLGMDVADTKVIRTKQKWGWKTNMKSYHRIKQSNWAIALRDETRHGMNNEWTLNGKGEKMEQKNVIVV